MKSGTILLLGVGAALLFFTKKPAGQASAPQNGTPQNGTAGMGRRIHYPEEYQAASVILGAASAQRRGDKISNRAKRILANGIKVKGGLPIQVEGKNNVYVGKTYSPDSIRRWRDLVKNSAAVLANRDNDFYPHKSVIYSSLSRAQYRRRFGVEPPSIYDTQHSPRNRPSSVPSEKQQEPKWKNE